MDEDGTTRTPAAPTVVPAAADPLAGVDAALAGLDDRDLSEHVAVYSEIHDALSRTLAATADGGPAAGGVRPAGSPGRR
ncbi:hypothetical protein [Nakamurella endophytica]|uniref:Uncharacterized protein n=1 Tax=Nakamurella endophytica TaxID=1748367 RepID=A0A917T8K5_9ACTN|nr:hypothetical protein [Nakamurella endophytica]GGM13461.1 hypothetical protein GCM10011594_36720 [Nakamurella endophytica]